MPPGKTWVLGNVPDEDRNINKTLDEGATTSREAAERSAGIVEGIEKSRGGISS